MVMCDEKSKQYYPPLFLQSRICKKKLQKPICSFRLDHCRGDFVTKFVLALNIIVVITFENAKHQVMKKAIKRKVYIRDTPHSNGNESVKSYFADLVCTTKGTPTPYMDKIIGSYFVFDPLPMLDPSFLSMRKWSVRFIKFHLNRSGSTSTSREIYPTVEKQHLCWS